MNPVTCADCMSTSSIRLIYIFKSYLIGVTQKKPKFIKANIKLHVYL